MSEVVQLIPEFDPERDAQMFKDWRRGKKTIAQLAREHALAQSHVTMILDHYLPALTPQAQVRELRKLLHDLEELRCTYHDIATSKNDPEAANVAVRTTHEIAQLRMFVGGGQQTDPIQLTRQANPRSHERSTAAYERQLALLVGKPTDPAPVAPAPGEAKVLPLGQEPSERQQGPAERQQPETDED